VRGGAIVAKPGRHRRRGPIEQVLSALNDAGVRSLVVGGVAVVRHGHLRATADLDLVVQLDEDNARRAVTALTSLGFRPRAPVRPESFADAATRRAWVRDKGLTVFSLSVPERPGLEVDLFVEEPFDFAAVAARAVRVRLDTIDAPVIALDDLIEMKTGVDRPRDREDVQALRALQQQRDAPGSGR
jgi:predicted nucleotidyltransferase